MIVVLETPAVEYSVLRWRRTLRWRARVRAGRLWRRRTAAHRNGCKKSQETRLAARLTHATLALVVASQT